MNDATLRTEGVRPTLQFERTLPHPILAVWTTITDGDELQSWFPCEIVVDEWAPGAPLTFVFHEHPHLHLTGTVLDVDTPTLLEFMWGEERLRFELTALGDDSTRLVFTDELPASIAARNAAGWEICLDRLLAPSPATGGWQERFDRYVAAFEPTLGAQEGPPPAPSPTDPSICVGTARRRRYRERRHATGS